MHYKILPTKEFSKDFKKLDASIQKRIKNKVEEVAEELDSVNERIRDQTFLIGKEKPKEEKQAQPQMSSHSEDENDDGENYLVKHLVRIYKYTTYR